MSQLYRSGIQTENSDIRAHVSVVNKEIYVFKTCDGLDAIEKYDPPIRSATQQGADNTTAEGWIIKWGLIENIKFFPNPHFDWDIFYDKYKMNTSEKGDAAAKCVISAMKEGRFPFWVAAQENGDKHIQIAGTDIIVTLNLGIQVKCDWNCGRKPKGTGNLFLQKSERNPFKRI